MAKSIKTADFEKEVLQSDIPVLVDFWASWCGPCKMLTPVIEEIAQELEGKVNVVKVNVDEEGELAQNYGVMSIPTLILFKDGKEAKKEIGFREKSKVLEMISD